MNVFIKANVVVLKGVNYLNENFKYKLKLELNQYTTWGGQCIGEEKL